MKISILGFRLLTLFILGLSLFGCGDAQKNNDRLLPIIKDITPAGDTVYHVIPEFRFVDQDSNWVTPETFKDKIYVTDFFFTSCPSICPKMKQQMVRLHDEFIDEPGIALLSHTIDPEYDTVGVLKDFAEALGVSSNKWHMVTGDKGEIYDISKNYLVSVVEDENAPGGFIHGGHFILVDKEKRVRSYYDGTQAEDVDRLMDDIKYLIHGDSPK